MAECSQCGTPAIWKVAGNLLCVDCYSKFQNALAIQQQQNAAIINYLSAQFDAFLPFGPPTPRLNMPSPTPNVQHQGDVVFNNISVDRSVVGAINTAEVKHIDVSLDQIRMGGNDELVSAAGSFTEAVLSAKDLSDEQKKEILEQVSFLTSQTLQSTEKRKLGLVKAAFQSLNQAAGTIHTLGEAWGKLEPLLQAVF